MTSQQAYFQFLQQWQKTVSDAAQTWANTYAKQPEANPMDAYRQMFEMWLKAFSGTMSQAPSMDMASIRKFWDESLDVWTRTLAEKMGSQEYATFMAQVLGQNLTAQGAATQAMTPLLEETWKTFNLPSRMQVLAMAEQLNSIERRLESLEDRLEEMQNTLPARRAAAPKRRA